MSGIAGVINLDGAPVDPLLIGQLTSALRRRGGDSEGSFAEGGIGLCHSLLNTGAEPEQQRPLTLDGAVWITADARVDGRGDLIRKLAATGAGREGEEGLNSAS